MQNVSTSFDEKMSLNTRPAMVAEVEFRQLTLNAAENATITATGQDSISVPQQLVNNTPDIKKYNTLETGGWVLDGSGEPIRDTIPTTVQTGEWSEVISDENCNLSIPLVVTATQPSTITSVGITVIFDTVGYTYAPEFTIQAYNGTTLVKTISATADGPYCVIEEPIENYTKIIVTIAKWSQPGVYARVGQIRFGIIRIYGNEELVEFSVLNNIDPVNKNPAAGEIAFSFDNRDGKFDFENPAGIYSYVVLNQDVVARIGFPGEMVQVAKNKMSSWAGGSMASFRALDVLNVADTEFADATYTSQTLTAICTAALTQAGITGYSLASALSGITVTAEIKNASCLDILKWAATAARLTLYVDYTGKLIIGSLPTEVLDYIIDYSNSPKPTPTMDLPLKSISVDYVSGGATTTVKQSYESYGQEITVSGNPFIQSEATANAVLAWEAAYYQRRRNYRSDWRQNPKIETGDIIGVKNDYGTPNAQVLSQRYTFSGGGLSGQTISKGV